MIKKRIIQLIEYKGIAKEDFYKKIGMTSANFRGKAKETPINSNAIVNILSEIPDLNPEWLLTGKGEMLKKEKLEDTKPGELEKRLLELLNQKDRKIEQLKKELESKDPLRIAAEGKSEYGKLKSNDDE